MVRFNTPTVDEYWEALKQRLPAFAPEDQRVAVTLYRELAKGQPIGAEQLGGRDALRPFAYQDDQGRILGFGGLAAAPMHHRFEVDGRTLWTWCAWDALFIPGILGKRARVVSPDPETGESVRLVVTPHEIESAEPEGVGVSLLLPDTREFDTSANVMAKFCHFVFFFASEASGKRWVAKHPGTFLYSLDQAFALAQRLNARNFGPELARRASAGRDGVEPSLLDDQLAGQM